MQNGAACVRSASPARCAIRPSTIRSRRASAIVATAGRRAISTSAPSSPLRPSVQPFVDLLGLVDSSIDAPTVRKVLRSWGPGKFDAELLLDGKAFRPDGKSAATLIPPAFGLAGVNLHTWTGWGSVTHWNGFVANLEMQGRGTFYDPRLNDADEIPDRRAGRFRRRAPTIPTSSRRSSRHCTSTSSACRRPARHAVQLRRGGRRARRRALRRQGGLRALPRAAAVHGARLEHAHAGGDRHRLLPGRALARRALPDGPAQGTVDARARAATTTTAVSRGSRDVVAHYDRTFALGLSAGERRDLVEYLKSL